MSLKIYGIHHVQVTVPKECEQEAIDFYGKVLGFSEIPKPDNLRQNGGAWYKVGALELHVSLEPPSGNAGQSKRHLCYLVEDLAVAESALRNFGIPIIEDTQPTIGWNRFYVRDPGGNRIEITQRL